MTALVIAVLAADALSAVALVIAVAALRVAPGRHRGRYFSGER